MRWRHPVPWVLAVTIAATAMCGRKARVHLEDPMALPTARPAISVNTTPAKAYVVGPRSDAIARVQGCSPCLATSS
jgi:hypothetical protein